MSGCYFMLFPSSCEKLRRAQRDVWSSMDSYRCPHPTAPRQAQPVQGGWYWKRFHLGTTTTTNTVIWQFLIWQLRLVISGDIWWWCNHVHQARSSYEVPQKPSPLDSAGGIWRDDGCADRCSCRYIYIYIMLPLYTFVYLIWLIWLIYTYMTYMCAGLKWFESRLHLINSSGARLGSCKKSWNGI